MTRRELERILQGWKKRLPLDAWSVKISWERFTDNGDDANVWIPNDYFEAEVVVSCHWASWSADKANRILLHELMHVSLRELAQVERRSAGLLGLEAQRLSERLWDHAEEGIVDAFADRLVDAWGLV